MNENLDITVDAAPVVNALTLDNAKNAALAVVAGYVVIKTVRVVRNRRSAKKLTIVQDHPHFETV